MTRLDRYSGAIAAAVALVGVGVVANADALLVSATVPLIYVVYGSLSTVGVTPDTVDVERSLERTGAFPGERIEVELTVRNEGGDPLADLRVVDDVPDALPVVAGTPRGAVALRPGEAVTIEYTVVANRGTHSFGPATVRGRSLSGTDVETVPFDPADESTIVCTPEVDDVPLQVQTTNFAGRVRTDSGGSGVEFHSTREYQHGDPMARIDWRRLAKGQELTTIDFREYRAARVVLLVDARDVCHVAPRRGIPTGAAMSAFGASRALSALLSEGHEVGAAAFGVHDKAGVGPAWVEPGRGEELVIRVRNVLDAAAATPDDGADTVTGSSSTGRSANEQNRSGGARDGGSTTRPDTGQQGDAAPAPDGGIDDVDVLRERLPPDAQVLFFTPAVDSFPRTVVRRLRAFGHGVTVVSPDVTHDDTPGGQLRTVERTLLIEDLRGAGARTIDWSRDRPLSLVLSEALTEVIT